MSPVRILGAALAIAITLCAVPAATARTSTTQYSQPSFSPDGVALAYVSTSTRAGVEFVIEDGSRTTALHFRDPITQLRWSPDSTLIAVLSAGRLAIVDRSTGVALPASAKPAPGQGRLVGWSADSSLVLFCSTARFGTVGHVWLANRQGSTMRIDPHGSNVRIDRAGTPRCNGSFSADSRYLAFDAVRRHKPLGWIFRREPDEYDHSIGHVSTGSVAGFSADGAYLLLRPTGTGPWWVVAVKDARRQPLPHDAVPVWSPHGALLAYSRHSKPGIWVLDGATRKTRRLSKAWAVPRFFWSPDGTQIACSNLGLAAELVPVAGGARTTLPGKQPLGFSPDGRWLVVSGVAKYGYGVFYAVPIGHDGPPVPVLIGHITQSPTWSRDSQSIGYFRTDFGGTTVAVVQHLDGTEVVIPALPEEGFSTPRPLMIWGNGVLGFVWDGTLVTVASDGSGFRQRTGS